MRLVQAGYERCAADYQTRIKALNAQTQVSIEEEHSTWHKTLLTQIYEIFPDLGV